MWIIVVVVIVAQGLRFNFDNKLKILQLTDLHFGEGMDDQTQELIFSMVSRHKADLVVISGDMVSGNLQGVSFREGWLKATWAMRVLKQPYAFIFGNHDDEAELTRKQIVELEQTHPYSLTRLNTYVNFEGSDYVVELKAFRSDDVVGLVWLFDSHNKGCLDMETSWGCVADYQQQWFTDAYHSYRRRIESIAFVHIAPPEIVELHDNSTIIGSTEPKISYCPCRNSNLVQTLMENDVKLLLSGHDHGSDFYGAYGDITLGYGRRSGYGEPLDMIKGGRIIMLESYASSLNFKTHLEDQYGNLIETREMNAQNKLIRCSC